jgi:hypothetical protein
LPEDILVLVGGLILGGAIVALFVRRHRRHRVLVAEFAPA